MDNRINSTAVPVIQLSFDGKFIKEWSSASLVTLKLGIDKSSIYKCIKGKIKHAGGYKWKFKS